MKLPFFGSRARRERELDEEIRAHLAMATADHAARGSSPAESARAARREFGNVTHVKEITREAWGSQWIWHLTSHLRLAVRSLGRTPGLVIAVVLTLALGIGATSTLFAIVDRLFLRASTGVAAARTLHCLYVITRLTDDGLPALQPQFGYGDYLALADGLRSDGELTAFSPPDSVSLSIAGEAQPVRAVYASSNYFSLLGLRPQLGRFFSADEERMGSPILSAVMSDGLWKRSFGSRRDVVGATVTIDGRQFTMVGIAPPGFAGTDLSDADVWPCPFVPNGGNVLTIRARPGQEAQASQRVWRALRRRFPSAEPPIVVSLADVLTPQMRPWRIGASLFSGFGVLALIIAFVGLYGLVSYGVTQRSWELGLRLALGAPRESIVSLVVKEGLGFVAIGIAVGTVLSLLSGHAIAALLYETSPYDPRVLVGVALLLCGCAAAASFAPGWRASRIDPVTALRAQG